MKRILLILITLCSTCAAAEITSSTLEDKREDRREKAFGDWIPVAESQARFNQLNREGMFQIYSERKDGKVRDLYIDKPDDLAY